MPHHYHASEHQATSVLMGMTHHYHASEHQARSVPPIIQTQRGGNGAMGYGAMGQRDAAGRQAGQPVEQRHHNGPRLCSWLPATVPATAAAFLPPLPAQSYHPNQPINQPASHPAVRPFGQSARTIRSCSAALAGAAERIKEDKGGEGGDGDGKVERSMMMLTMCLSR